MKLKSNIKSVTAFAPATCANVAVGFDILGFSVDSIGDYVTLTRRKDNQIILEKMESQSPLPQDPKKNVASAVIQKICDDLNITEGFSIHLRKEIALSSGMGGSAASAVAALIAFNEFLLDPLTKNNLIPYALYGEKIACGHAHADNIVPCLMGGFTLTRRIDPLDVIQLPILNCFYVIAHPHLQVDTKLARSVLKNELPLKEYVLQSANLASFIAAWYERDFALIQRSLSDVLIEPRRASLVPGFYKVKSAALEAGALGVSFSGSGPSLFAFAETEQKANDIGKAMHDAFIKEKIKSDIYVNRINPNGAKVLDIRCRAPHR